MDNVAEGLIHGKKELHSHWLLTDTLLLNMVLLSLHWDRFVLETWRFIDFERTFTYAYDAEGFFIYPIFLFQVGVLIIHHSNLHETLSRVAIYFLYLVVIIPGYLLCFDYIYRLRLLLTVGLMFSAASLALSTCFNLAQRHQVKKYNDSLKRKVAKRKKKLLKETKTTASGVPTANTKAWLDEFDIKPTP